MIKNLFFMSLMAVATLSISYLMIPRSKEIALMQLKSKEFDTAQISFEKQLAEGDYSVSVVVPLSEIYVHQGEIERSIALLEQFLDRQPDHITGLQRLAQYFSEAQKPHGYVRALARLAELNPGEGHFRQLAIRHDLLLNETGEQEALLRLIDDGVAKQQEYDRLARHQAAAGHLGNAAATLTKLLDKFPKTVEPESVELLVGLKLELGDISGALETSDSFLKQRADRGFSELLASRFADHRRLDLALQVLNRQSERTPNDASLVTTMVQYETRMGNSEGALRRVRNFRRSNPLPEKLNHDLVILLLTEGQPEEALDEFYKLNARYVPEWLVHQLLNYSAEHNLPYLIAGVPEFLGDTYLSDRPVLGAEIALARGDREEAKVWIDWAENENSRYLPYRDRLVMARLYHGIDRPEDSITLLRRLAAEIGDGSTKLAKLGDMYLSTDRANDGLAMFEELRKSHPGKDIDVAWARLAAKSKRAGAVLNWINSTPDISSDVLEDIYHFAELNRQPALAFGAADRLHAKFPGTKSQRLRARAFAALGQNEQAIARFSGLIENGVKLDSYDLAALSKIGATNQLERYWKLQPGNEGGNAENRLVAMFTGMRRAAIQLVLPKFENLAREEGGFWLDTYAETAQLAGETSRLREFLKAESERTDLPPTETKKIATALFDVAPRESVNLFARMARQDPDGWGDAYIETLLALGRNTEMIRFLVSEVNRENIQVSKRDARLYALMEAGGPAAAEKSLSRLARTEGGDWEYAYEEALVSLGKEQTLFDFLTVKAEGQNLDAEQRNGIAFRLLEGGRKQAAEQNFLKLASSAGPEDAAVQQLLYLWGPRPEVHQLDWIEDRALSANGKDRVQWLAHLRDRGAGDRVIQLLETNPAQMNGDGNMRKLYLEAIVSRRDTVRLRQAIRSELARKQQPEKIRELAKLAVQEDIGDVATEAYRSLFQLRPGDIEAAGWLGRVAYAEGRRAEALEMIGLTLGKNAQDYETQYIYGELLYADERRVEALPYLKATKKLIEATPRKTVEMRLAWGQTLFRLGLLEQAIEVYADLYAERGDDAGIRADYAGLLIDARNFERAQTVLWSN